MGSNIKLSIPSFEGLEDPGLYFEWESKINRIFACYELSEEKKCKLAVVEFSGLAAQWWERIGITRHNDLEPPITTWSELIDEMRYRFVLYYYKRDLHQKLQRLRQGTSSVSHFYHELLAYLTKLEIHESVEATMARFQGGLQRDIGNQLDFYHYESLEEMFHVASKIERQLQAKSKQFTPYQSRAAPSNVTKTWPQTNQHPSTPPFNQNPP